MYLLAVQFTMSLGRQLTLKTVFNVYIHTVGITGAGDPESCCSGFRIM